MPARQRPRDLRGPQSRIGRLARFHVEGYVHVLAYRILVPLMLLYGILVIVFLLVPGLATVLKAATAVIWVLWAPQLFEVMKGLALAWSRGMAYGNLNPEFAHLYRKRYGKRPGFYVALPWIFLVVWAAGFILMIARWHP